MNESWVLKAKLVTKFGYQQMYSDGYYTGKSFIHNQEKYAVVNSDINSAKKYTSYARAVSAANKLSFYNYSFEVKRASEEGV